MLRKEDAGIVWFEFALLQQLPFVRHGCFARKGGISAPPFDSLNIQPFPEESPLNIAENKKRIQKILGSKSALLDLEQVHGVDIAVVDMLPQKTPLGQFDAVMTQTPHIPLTIKHADCQACLFVDPEHKAIAAVHCGWRGNVQNIYGHVVEKMRMEYGTRPEALLACIGPSLGPCHSEFKEWKTTFPPDFWPRRERENHFDLWEIAYQQLIRSGVQAGHIEIAKMCTFQEKELFFSFRRDGLTGRNATCILIQ